MPGLFGDSALAINLCQLPVASELLVSAPGLKPMSRILAIQQPILCENLRPQKSTV
jgi:hypothetical protein